MPNEKDNFARVHVRYRDDSEQDLKLPDPVPAECALSFASALFQLMDARARRILVEAQFLTMDGQQVRAFHLELKGGRP